MPCIGKPKGRERQWYPARKPTGVNIGTGPGGLSLGPRNKASVWDRPRSFLRGERRQPHRDVRRYHDPRRHHGSRRCQTPGGPRYSSRCPHRGHARRGRQRALSSPRSLAMAGMAKRRPGPVLGAISISSADQRLDRRCHSKRKPGTPGKRTLAYQRPAPRRGQHPGIHIARRRTAREPRDSRPGRRIRRPHPRNRRPLSFDGALLRAASAGRAPARRLDGPHIDVRNLNQRLRSGHARPAACLGSKVRRWGQGLGADRSRMAVAKPPRR